MPLIYMQRGRMAEVGGGVTQPSDFEAQGVTYTGNRPCLVWFRGDLYVIGSYTRPVVRHANEGGNFRIAGIRPPQVLLAVVPGADTGGSSGACLAFITFVHKAGGVVLAESNPSNVVNVGTLAGEGRVWSNIDNVTAENRVTHVRGYVSMAGGDFRMAWEAPYGLTTYTENVRTAQLTFVGPQLYQYRLPPSTRFGQKWVGRIWYANNPQRPYRIWFSEVGNGQYVRNASFRDTLGREAITGIWPGRHELLVFCERNSYMLRSASGQPGSDDFVMEQLDSDVGCITHHGIWEIHNKLWFPSEDGAWIYDGSFRYLMKEIQPLWATDWKNNKEALRNGFGMHDRLNKVYSFVTNRADRAEYEDTGLFPGTFAYAGYYGSFEPSMAGDSRHPDWSVDVKDRFDSAAFYNRDGELIIGSCDGKIRKQDESVGPDDGDLMGKPCIIRPGHWLFFEPGDDEEHAKTLLQLWAYVESEETGWTLYARGGDEKAFMARLPDNSFSMWKAEVDASGLTETRAVPSMRSPTGPVTYSLEYVPKTTHNFVPEKVTGRGFIMELRAQEPIGLTYRGMGGMYGPGAHQRPVARRTEIVIALLEISEDGIVWTALNPGDDATVTGAPTSLFFRVTLAYNYGAPGFPIAVNVTGDGGALLGEDGEPILGEDGEPLDSEISFSVDATMPGAALVVTTAAVALGVGTVALAVAATDANGVQANPLLYDITITGTA